MIDTELLIGGCEVIAALAAEWIALCSEGASSEPFYRPEWFAAFTASFQSQVSLLTVRFGGRLRAVLPMMKQRATVHGIPARKLQGVFNLNSQRFDLVHGAAESERKAVTQALWDGIKETDRWDMVEFRLVKSDSWLSSLVETAERDGYHTGIWTMDSAPFITLPQGEDKVELIDSFFKSMSKNRRRLLKKKRRLLEELGPVSIETTRGYSPELMAKYFELESRGWKGRSGTAATDDQRAAKLHNDFARAIASGDGLTFYELKSGEKTISMYIGIMFDGRTIGWKMSYDEEYARFSPGSMLFVEVLSDSIRRGSTELDHLSPPTYNKSQWATGEREHVAFCIFQRGLFGTLLWIWKFSIVQRIRQLRHKEYPWLGEMKKETV